MIVRATFFDRWTPLKCPNEWTQRVKTLISTFFVVHPFELATLWTHMALITIVKLSCGSVRWWVFNRISHYFPSFFSYFSLFVSQCVILKRLNKFVEWCGLFFCSRFANLIYEPCGFSHFFSLLVNMQNLEFRF